MTERHPVLRQTYLVAAVVAFVATFAPLYAANRPDDRPDDVYATMNLWKAVQLDGGGAGLVGLLFVAVITAVAVRAGVRTRHDGLTPVVAVALGVVGAIILIAKPSTSASNPPALGVGGEMLFGVCVLLVVVAATDLYLLMVKLADSGHRLATAREAHS